MAATINPIKATNTWQSVAALSGLAAGSAMKVQNNGGLPVIAVLAAAEPSPGMSGDILYPERMYAVAAGEPEMWVKVASSSNTQAALSVQAN